MIKLLPSVFLSLLLAGCSSIPHQRITVIDESGDPIRGAGLRAPYPILIRNMILPRDAPSANSTNSKGRLVVYDMKPGKHYMLRAPGYEDKEISFPEDNRQTYVLRREQKNGPNKAE
ncbi:MAG: hypothetical protein WD342_19835 [Verrucomicrobiales bacterium]